MCFLFSNPENKAKTTPKNKTNKQKPRFHSSSEIDHAGHKQRVDQQGAAAATGHFYSDTPQAGPPHQSRERSHCWPLWPPLGPALVLVTLLVQRGRYLFLHQPQLITQVAVGFHKVLDLGFRGREGVLHLHVFLHSNGAVWEVRVKALWKGGVKRWNAGTKRETVSSLKYSHDTLVLSPLLDGRSWSVSSSDATLS